jgi:hypothetical protein
MTTICLEAPNKCLITGVHATDAKVMGPVGEG